MKLFRVAEAPYKQIYDSIDVSSVNGIYKPIPLKFLRADYSSCIAQDESGNLGIFSTVIDQFAELNSGDNIAIIDYTITTNGILIDKIIKTDDFIKAYDSLIILNQPFEALGSVVVINENYLDVKLQTTIKSTIDPSPTFVTIGENQSDNDLNYIFNVNIAPYLKSLVLKSDEQDYLSLSDSLPNNKMFKYYTHEFKISYEFEGVKTTITPVIDLFSENDTFPFINAVKQIGEIFGNNFADFIQTNDSNTPAKLFLGTEINPSNSLQKSMTYFYGFPFAFSFIAIPKTVDGYDLKRKYVLKDINGNILDTNIINLITDSQFRYIIVKDSLFDSQPLTNTFEISMFYDNGIDQINSTFVYSLNVERRCFENPVYLSWLNTDGSRNYWLFENKQDLLTATDETIYYKYFEDIETQNGNDFITGRNARNKIIVGDIVPSDKYKTIKTLFYSSNIQILLNPDTWKIDGCKWFTVRIEEDSFECLFSTDAQKEIRFTLITNEINTQNE